MDTNKLDNLKNTLLEANHILGELEASGDYRFAALKYFIVHEIIHLIEISNGDKDVFVNKVFEIDRGESILEIMHRDTNWALTHHKNKSLETLEKLIKEIHANNSNGVLEIVERY